MKHIVKTEADWLDLRKKYVTASEAAVLVGADPYSSPIKLRRPSTFTGNYYTDVGHLLEPIVVLETNKVTGMNFELYETEDGTKEFYTEGGLGATPDAHQGRSILLECKTTRHPTYLKYSAVPPNKYLIQLQVQMMCTEINDGYLSLMCTGTGSEAGYNKLLLTDFEQLKNKKWETTVFHVKQSNQICDILITEAKRFQDNEKFRVNSKIKQTVALLLPTIYERVT